MHFLRDVRRDDSSEYGTEVFGDLPTRKDDIEGVRRIILRKVPDVGKLEPEWVSEVVAEEIFAPHLINPHIERHWRVALFRDFLWDLGQSPSVAWIRDLEASVAGYFEVSGWGREARMRQHDAVYRMAQAVSPVAFTNTVRSIETSIPDDPLAETARTSISIGGGNEVHRSISQWRIAILYEVAGISPRAIDYLIPEAIPADGISGTIPPDGGDGVGSVWQSRDPNSLVDRVYNREPYSAMLNLSVLNRDGYHASCEGDYSLYHDGETGQLGGHTPQVGIASVCAHTIGQEAINTLLHGLAISTQTVYRSPWRLWGIW